MMFAMGPVPDQMLIETRPENVSMEAALGAWHAAYSDARNERPYHVFPPDTHDLQEFYEDGYLRGQRDKLHMQRINERLGPEAAEEQPRTPESTPGDRLLKAIFPYRTLHDHLLENSALLQALATASVAVALLVRGQNRRR